MATVVEMPPVRHRHAVGMALTQVVDVGVTFGQQRIDPDLLKPVVVRERDGGRLGTAGA